MKLNPKQLKACAALLQKAGNESAKGSSNPKVKHLLLIGGCTLVAASIAFVPATAVLGFTVVGPSFSVGTFTTVLTGELLGTYHEEIIEQFKKGNEETPEPTPVV